MRKLFGIIGNPISHSLSPVLHNYWFRKYGIDAEYSIINIKDNELPSIIKKIKDKRRVIQFTYRWKTTFVNS